MTVENTTNKKRFLGNGTSTEVTFNFRVFDPADLKVYVYPEDLDFDDLEDYLLSTDDYSVTLEEDGEGGSIELDVAPTALEAGLVLNLLPLTQTADLPTEGNFNEESVEDALDRLCMQNIQQQERIGRGVSLRDEDPLATDDFEGFYIEAVLPEDRAGKLMKFSDAGDGIEASTLDEEDLSTLGGISAEIQTLAAIADEIVAVAAFDADDLADVAAIAAQVLIVAGISAQVVTVAGIAAEIDDLADVATQIAQLALIIPDIVDAANNIPKSNRAATTNPTVGDDTGDGYSEGSLWINVTANTAYLCLDAAPGAAIWQQITTSGTAAEDVSYDNALSGLSATDVQAAIDELAGGGSGWVPLEEILITVPRNTSTNPIELTEGFDTYDQINIAIFGLEAAAAATVLTANFIANGATVVTTYYFVGYGMESGDTGTTGFTQYNQSGIYTIASISGDLPFSNYRGFILLQISNIQATNEDKMMVIDTYGSGTNNQGIGKYQGTTQGTDANTYALDGVSISLASGSTTVNRATIRSWGVKGP